MREIRMIKNDSFLVAMNDKGQFFDCWTDRGHPHTRMWATVEHPSDAKRFHASFYDDVSDLEKPTYYFGKEWEKELTGFQMVLVIVEARELVLIP